MTTDVDGRPTRLDAVARPVRRRPGRRAAGLHRQPAVRPAAVARRHRRLARPRRAASPASACSPTTSATACSPRSTQVADELATGTFEFVRQRRGHPHRGRAAGHRARRAGRRQAAHRPQPQRPGRDRPAAVVQARAASRSPGASSACRRCCSTRADEAGDDVPARLHAPAAGAAGAARPPPAGPRLGARPRRRPARWRRSTGSTSRRSAPARWPARRCRSTRRAPRPSSGSPARSTTRSTPSATATSSPRRCSTWR